MSEPAGEQVPLVCPSCSPDIETVHEVLSEGGGWATVRCTDCEHVHKEQLPDAEEVDRDVVISQGDESVTATVSAPRGETIARGEEFVVETEAAIHEVRITDLQLGPEERVPEAPVEEVRTIWTRAVDNVGVNVTVNPADGSDESYSETVYVPGDHEFVVGEEAEIADSTLSVTTLMVRDDAVGYDANKLARDGDRAPAKDLKRVYAEATGRDSAWSGW